MRKKRQDGTGTVYARYKIHTKTRKEGFLGWWVKIYVNGMQIVRNAHTTDKDQAKAFLAELVAQQARGAPIPRRELTLKDGASNANRTAKLNGRLPSKAYDNHLIPFFGARAKMSAITAIRVKEYAAHKLKAGLAPATVNRHLEALRRAFTVAVQDGALAARPHVPRLKENNVKTGFFERQQFDALRRHLPRPRKKPRTEAEIAADPLVAVVTFGWITGGGWARCWGCGGATSISRPARCGSSPARRRTARAGSSR
jgi:hypothetical protein